MTKFRKGLLFGVCLLAAACATTSSVSSIKKEGSAYNIALPIGNQIINFPAKDFKLKTADDSRPYYFLTNSKTGLNVSFNFERATSCNDSKSCRDYFANKLKAANFMDKKNWRMFQVGKVSVSENMDGPVGGLDLKMQHMNAHYVTDGVWVDMHMSKVDYEKSDKKLFVNFIKSVKFQQKKN